MRLHLKLQSGGGMGDNHACKTNFFARNRRTLLPYHAHSGWHFAGGARLIEQLGNAEQLTSKTKFGVGADVTEVTLASGPGALGFTQISEIVNKKGAAFVGPLPEELQNYTLVAVGVPVGRKWPALETFLSYLKSPGASAAMQAAGMQLD